jgi:ADP-heptose:LPS heptosyltransferase
MIHWPSSTPDYRWPERLLRPGLAPLRWFLAATFHVSCALGRLAAVFRRNPPDVLVIRTDGIGDAVLFEPALRSLASTFPEASIHLWATAPIVELFRHHPGVKLFRQIPRGAKPGNLQYFGSLKWRWLMGWRFGRSQFSLCVYAALSPEPMGNWILRSVRARQKWYTPGDTENQFEIQRSGTAALATRVLSAPRDPRHELHRNSYLAGQWQGTISDRPMIHIGPAAARDAESIMSLWRRFAGENGAGELTGIMAGSATSVNAYPVHSWAAVIRDLWQTRRACCVLFGSDADRARVDEISRLIADLPHRKLAAHTPLLTTAALLSGLDGFISMDTGLAHIAMALDVPAVVLANGGHPRRFFPWPMATRSVTLTHRMPCEGCLCRCVLAEAECITRIKPAQVVAAYESLVPRTNLPARCGSTPPKSILCST